MNESSWKRLHRIIEERRSRLGYTRNGLQAVGGPSSETLRALRDREGPPSIRQRASIDDLDEPLGWPDGTAWSLAVDDRSGWSAQMLADEEESLINGPSLSSAENTMRAFQTQVLSKLRAMNPVDAELAMIQIARIVGIE